MPAQQAGGTSPSIGLLVSIIAVSAAAGMAAPPASVDDANMTLVATVASAAGAAMAVDADARASVAADDTHA